MTRTLLTVAAIVLVFSGSARAQAPPDGQLWGDFILSWAKTHRLAYDLDIEPKVLVIVPAGQPDWATLDVTPSVDYAATRWLDVVGEFLAASTRQTNDVNSRELTERAGVRFHLFARNVPVLRRDREFRELPPGRRLVVRDFARIEQRNLFYSNEEGDHSSWRFRNRLEVQFPLNQKSVTADKTRYVLSDWEWFVPINDQPRERYANKQRIRVGLGYRRNFAWRYEALYIWGRSLDTTSDSFTTSDNIIDFRVKRVF